MVTKIKNGVVVTDGREISGCNVYIRDGRIEAVTSQERVADVEYDAENRYISAGFIDLHTHGGGGSDFMDGTNEAFTTAARAHLEHGTTALYPTVLSGSYEEMVQTCETFLAVKDSGYTGAELLGLHLEGPYFAPSQKGAQDSAYIRDPDPAEYETLVNTYPGVIRRWTSAPERDGAEAFAAFLKEHNILASIGHSDADCRDAYRAYEWGYRHITHLYSCTTAIYRKNAKRYAGMNEAAYLHDGLSFEIIADGVHLPPELLQFVYRFKPTDKVALITDSMRAAAYGEGVSILGSKTNGQKVIVEDGVAKLPDRSAFAGSVLTMDRAVCNMVKLGGVPLAKAVRMATQTPAQIMGLSDRGQVKEGLRADLVLFDRDIHMHMVFQEGKVTVRK